MSRLIYADAVLYALVEEGHDNATKYGFRLGDTIKFTPTQVDEIVSRMPTIEERKKGKWEMVTDNNGQHAVCDQCGEWRYHQGQKFCGECGADMRKDGAE